MIVSRDGEALDHIKYISTQAKDDPLFYVHNEVGYNYRMTNVQAAIGVDVYKRQVLNIAI